MNIDILGIIIFLTTLATATFLGLAPLWIPASAQLRTRLRNATRRATGIEAFERLMLDELRQQSKRTSYLEADRAQRHKANDLTHAHTRLSGEVLELRDILKRYTDALGPVWTTAEGHALPLAMLSTTHLRNILYGCFVSPGHPSKQFIVSELERRRIDAVWRKSAAEGLVEDSAKGLVEDSAKGPVEDSAEGLVDPRLPMTYTPEIAARVSRTLPVWAQDIVTRLTTNYGPFDCTDRSVSRAERRRMRTLPLWAQQLISDLEQPR